MSGHENCAHTRPAFLAAALVLLLAINLAGAQYWFQTGAQATQQAEFNSGASVTIQTITPQPVGSGSLGFWIGETLSNGAFIQAGYEIPNQTGYYPTGCTQGACSGKVLLHAGVASWFWEYFLPNSSASSFLGDLGPDGSAGANGTLNTYSFQAVNNEWYVYFDGAQVGQVNLGTASSGSHVPLGIAEYAETDTNTNYMPNVEFEDMEYYDGTSFRVVPKGISLVDYGVGSEHGLSNPYGVREYGNLVNNFVVGSSIPLQTGVQLWSIGYSLRIISQYGNINSTANYTPYSSIQITAPQHINLTSTERLEFNGWSGSGNGAYTGQLINATVTMNQNVTERASWVVQYYVNATTQYGQVSGGGWQDANSIAHISLDTNSISAGIGKRAIFTKWSNGVSNESFAERVIAPMAVSPEWEYQYLVNATSPYGNVTGSGWYYAGSLARISIGNSTVYLGNDTRAKFINWSDGNSSAEFEVNVTTPILVNARFDKEYLLGIMFENAYGEPIPVSRIGFDGDEYNGTSAFVDPSLRTNEVNYAYYKGVNITAGYKVNGVTPTSKIDVVLPVYNITISAKGELGFPINASANLTFLNGTTSTYHTGSSGVLVLRNVPYGQASGELSYFAVSQPINASYGGIIEDTFVTPVLAFAVLVVLGIIFLIEREYFRMQESGRRRRKR